MTDDDGPPVVRIDGPSVEEGDNGSKTLTFTITLTPASGKEVSVDYADTETGTATSGVDYTAITSKTVEFAAGETSKTVEVSITGDVLDEENETIILRLSSAVNATFPRKAGAVQSTLDATGTIIDNDDAAPLSVRTVTLILSSPSITENGGQSTVTASLDEAVSEDVIVTVSATPTAPASTGDFTLSQNKTLTIKANSTSSTGLVTIDSIDNSMDNPDKIITVSATISGGVANPGDVTLTITDDDDAPENIMLVVDTDSDVDGNQDNINENAESTSVVITASVMGDTTYAKDVMIEVYIENDTAEAGTDFVQVKPFNIVIKAGASSGSSTFMLTPMDDNVIEIMETISVTGAAMQETPPNVLGCKIMLNDNDKNEISTTNIIVEDASANESDLEIRFKVMLEKPVTQKIDVSYYTRESNPTSARQNIDYKELSGNASFSPGETEKEIVVEIYDDYHQERDETFELVVSSKGLDDAVAVGTIMNMDSQPPQWLSRFGRTVAEQNLEAIRDRVTTDRSSGFSGQFIGQPLRKSSTADAQVAGNTDGNINDQDGSLSQEASWPMNPVRDTWGVDGFDNPTPESREVTDDEILLGTSFALTKINENDLSFGIWGRAAKSGYSGGKDEQAVEGEVSSMMFGADWQRNKTIFGMMAARSKGKGVFGTSRKGEIEATLTSFVPYATHQINDNLSVWGAFGIGSGEMAIDTHFGDMIKTDIDWKMLAAGAEGTLVPRLYEGGINLNWTTDFLFTQTDSDEDPGLMASSNETTRFRAGIVADWKNEMESGTTVKPTLEVGIRYDGGDAETGIGLEVGGGIEWTNLESGLTVILNGRTLAVHEDGNFEDWGVALGIIYDPNPKTKEGFSAKMGYDLGGSASGGQQALIGPDTFPDLNKTESESSWSAEAAYGINQGGGMVGSPYAVISGESSEGIKSSKLGYRVEPDTEQAANINLDIWTNPKADDSDTSSGFGVTWQW